MKYIYKPGKNYHLPLGFKHMYDNGDSGDRLESFLLAKLYRLWP